MVLKVTDFIMILTLLLLVYSMLLIHANNSHNITIQSESNSLLSLIDSIGTKQFFNCDIGDGVRVEILTMLRSLGQNVMVILF